jgi:hypothetical protein
MNENIIEVFHILTIILLSVIIYITVSDRNNLKKQAVEKGYAEWVVESSGKTTWKWKDNK